MARPNRTANPMYIEAMQLIRRSNKAGAHDPRPNRLRTRAAVRRSEIRTNRESWGECCRTMISRSNRTPRRG